MRAAYLICPVQIYGIIVFWRSRGHSPRLCLNSLISVADDLTQGNSEQIRWSERSLDFKFLVRPSHSAPLTPLTISPIHRKLNLFSPSSSASSLPSFFLVSPVALDRLLFSHRCARLLHSSQANLLLPSKHSVAQK